MNDETSLSRAVSKPCTHCRQRKVKCDRNQPCAGCVRFAKVCTYEGSAVTSQVTTTAELSRSPSAVASKLDSNFRPSDQEEDVSVNAGSFVYDAGHSAYFSAGYWVSLFEEVRLWCSSTVTICEEPVKMTVTTRQTSLKYFSDLIDILHLRLSHCKTMVIKQISSNHHQHKAKSSATSSLQQSSHSSVYYMSLHTAENAEGF